MDIYRRHFRRTVFWYRTQLWNEKKIMQTPPLYYFFQMYAPTKCRASGLMNFHSANDDWALLNKFLRKYPESSLSTTYMTMEPEMYSTAPHHPGERFVTRQKYFMSEGYTEAKAFELVEKEMSESLQEEKYERAMIEGIATSNRARSLMSLYEQSAEYEARQKIDRLNREIPDFIRSQKKWEEEINDILDSKTVSESKDTKNTYEPVSYLIANSMKDKGDKFKSNKVVQNEFLLRAEKLMEFYHSFAHIKDGISMMNDKDIVLKANESPKKLKDSMKQFLKKIEKMNIKLNPKGDIDYSDITDKMLLNFIKKNERQIKVCLMYKDLEFEFPHKVHLSELKANIINDINYEEDKFRDFEQKQVQDKRVALEEELRRRIMTYERYFELPLNCEADKVDASIEEVRKKNLSIKKAYSFDEWVKIKSAENLFDQDLVKEQYHYFETSSEKEERIRRLWIDSKSTRIEASIDIPSNEEVSQLNSEIVQHIRILRKRIDQDLLNNYKHPVFGSNYRQYDINEFMIDSDVEFEKIKKFLSNNPKLIQTDKEIGDDYLKLMKKLRRKKMIEKSISRFGDEHIDDYYLVEEVESKEKFEEEMEVSSRKYIDMKENLLYDKISRELDSQKPDSVEGSIETRSKANMIDEEALEKKKIETIKERIMTNFKSALQKSDNTIELDKKKPAVKQGTGKRRAVSSEIGKKNPVKGNKNKV